MSSNHELVELFLSDKFRNDKQELAHLVSNKFKFTGLRSGTLDFSGYVEYAKKYYTEELVTIDWIESNDDQNFIIGYTVRSPTDRNKTLIGNLAIAVENGQIERVIE